MYRQAAGLCMIVYLQREYEESLNKARALLKALEQAEGENR